MSDLFITTDDGKFSARMSHDVLNVSGRGVDWDRSGNCACGLDGKFVPKPFRRVVTIETNDVAAVQTQAD